MGDPGTGINGTEGDSGYGTYNTVASSWKATVTYSGTKYTEDKDYKGTATYIGKILMNNSPTRNYTVTYKPNTMVSNASGIYYNNYMNNMYSKENAKLLETGASDLMGMYTTESAVKIPMIFTLLPWRCFILSQWLLLMWLSEFGKNQMNHRKNWSEQRYLRKIFLWKITVTIMNKEDNENEKPDKSNSA